MTSILPTRSSAVLSPEPECRSGVLKLPLHIVSKILAELDTVPQLYPILESHSIFRDAFQDNFHSVCYAIVTRQVHVFAFPPIIDALGLIYESPWDDDCAAGSLIEYLMLSGPSWRGRRANNPSQERLTFRDYSFISSHYASAEKIANEVVSSVITPLTLCWVNVHDEFAYSIVIKLASQCLLYSIPVNLLFLHNLYYRFPDRGRDELEDMAIRLLDLS
ncbi:hypothetical protein GGR53DRAFT_467237 [Hypoxylon sp. FL1150]|nr:hypothetical protein GGR53DRAFT_467237 [Hypoxylon sp. FL1150]